MDTEEVPRLLHSYGNIRCHKHIKKAIKISPGSSREGISWSPSRKRHTPKGLAEETLMKGLFIEVGRVKRTIKDDE